MNVLASGSDWGVSFASGSDLGGWSFASGSDLGGGHSLVVVMGGLSLLVVIGWVIRYKRLRGGSHLLAVVMMRGHSSRYW